MLGVVVALEQLTGTHSALQRIFQQFCPSQIGKGEIREMLMDFFSDHDRICGGIDHVGKHEDRLLFKIFDEYQKGDQLARIVIENALHHLAVSIINLEFIFD